jgi:uncharacterized protein
MTKILAFGLIGFFAQLIDGALGMAYGVSSTTLLLTVGIGAASASATVHLAEIATTFASGTAHWRFGNVDWRVVGRLAVPGFVGAFVGAVALSSLDAEAAEPIVAGILLALGVYVLVRFTRRGRQATEPRRGTLPAIFLAPLGLFAGALDAMGGGGWGPIGTPTLLASGRMEPRKVIGSIDTSEFLVALGASAGFLWALGSEQINYGWVGALVVGGLLAAPIAAWLVRALPAHVLGLSVGTLIIITNSKTLLEAAGVSDDVTSVLFVVFGVAWLALLGVLLLKPRGQAVLQS